VTNVTFIFATSPNTEPKDKNVGRTAYYVPPSEKVSGTRGRVPHLIAPMRDSQRYSKVSYISVRSKPWLYCGLSHVQL